MQVQRATQTRKKPSYIRYLKEMDDNDGDGDFHVDVTESCCVIACGGMRKSRLSLIQDIFWDDCWEEGLTEVNISLIHLLRHYFLFV